MKQPSLQIQSMLPRLIESYRAIHGKPNREFLIEIADTFSCDWIAYWRVTPQEQKLRPEIIWSSKSLSPSKLEEKTKERNLSLSEGMAGHVWRLKKAVLSSDLMRDMSLPRSIEAHSAKLRFGMWFPLMSENTILGVFELLACEFEPNEVLLETLENFGKSLGEIQSRFS